MEISDLRIALTSGNYNYTRDGANKSLNRLVGYLLKKGAAVRVYSPVVEHPAFEPTGDLIGTPAVPIPFRPEYRIPLGLGNRVRADVDAFRPNMIHVSAPEFLGHSALRYARAHDLPVVASVHTRFDTYFRYYNLGFIEPALTAMLRRFYRRCDAIVTPSESMAEVLRAQRMNFDVGIWSRGVEQDLFCPEARSLDWRRGFGIGDDEIVVGFVGRLVLEKGLDVFAEVVGELKRRGVAHRVLVVGKGPAEDWFRSQVPEAVFAGYQEGKDLGRAVASMDMLLNPSVTETFGNVTLEAMACGLPVVGADATGTSSLVDDGVTGRLIEPTDIAGYADALQAFIENADLRRDAGVAAVSAAKPYSWDAINGTLADTYLRVIRERAAHKR
jgi:glycosyltransferase involved in cell wall biosynthesis